MDRLTSILLTIIGFFSFFLPQNFRVFIGKIIGNILKLISSGRVKVARENLNYAFPEKKVFEIEKIIKKSYHNLGIVLVEVPTLKFMSDKRLKNIIKYKNIELLNQVNSRGKGLILLSGHFANWEYLAYSAGLFSQIPILIIVKPQKNVIVDKVLNKIRTKGNNSVVSMFTAAREIIINLKQKKAIALLVDQSASPDKDVFVDFFGRPAATYEAPAALALKFNVPIVYGFAIRQKDGTYSVTLYELIHDDLDDSPESVKILTERHVKVLEDAIRENPELWVWQHKRWKYEIKDYQK